MKFLSFILFLPIISSINASVKADVYVDGYFRSNGTYVKPHYRTSPNNTVIDNYSYPGNYNPNNSSTNNNSYRNLYSPSKPSTNPYNPYTDPIKWKLSQ